MLDATALFTAIRDVGLAVVIIVLSLWGLWKVVIPAVINQFKTQQDYYIAEIKSLRDEARNDKQLMFEAFRANTEANTQLKNTLEQVNDQLATLSTEVATVKNDMTKVYLILGNDKKLIDKSEK